MTLLKTIRVPDDLLELLGDVLTARTPQLVPILDNGPVVAIPAERARAVQELIGDELVESELDHDWEPTPRGRNLERLIDVFSPHN